MSPVLTFLRLLAGSMLLLSNGTSALADIPGLQVSGNTISWTTTGYMQVQNADSFETLCEGNQLTCIVPAGTYIVIDHSAGVRQEGIEVTAMAPPAIRDYTLVENRQIQQSAFPLNKYSLRAECPGGMIPIGGGCEGLLSDGTFSTHNFMPGSGHIALTLRAFVCNFVDLETSAGREVQLLAQASCVNDSDVRRLSSGP